MALVDDAITGEIIRNGLAVAAEEASIVVVRAGHSSHIQEGADACAAILDPGGQLIALSTATSLMHAASLRCSLPSLVEDFPLRTMAPGDVFALNDPYRGGIHANDILVFRPIFADGRVTYFAGTLIHVADVGGVSAAGLASLATDTFVEGLLLPPVHLARAGEPASDVAADHRPEQPHPRQGRRRRPGARRRREHRRRVGSTSCTTGTARPKSARFVWQALDDSERRMRDSLAALAPGRYESTFTIDSDGVEDRTFDVRVAVTLPGDGTVDVDLAGTSSQARGSINSSVSQTLSGIVYAVRCFADPTIPMNEGCFRPLRVHLPQGSLVNPDPPAACGGRLVTVAAATEAILAGAGPGRARSGGRRQLAHPGLRVERRATPTARRGSRSSTSSAGSAPASAPTAPMPPVLSSSGAAP